MLYAKDKTYIKGKLSEDHYKQQMLILSF